MATRIVVMHDGVIQQVGPPLELYDRPATFRGKVYRLSDHDTQVEGTVTLKDGARSAVGRQNIVSGLSARASRE